jgi:hypothetical protein
MKFRFRRSTSGEHSQCRGFALVITLTLLVLLTVISVGLLTLSSVSLRTASHGHSMAIARANAKLGLMLALGELQRTIGPDKAITANSEIAGASPGKPNLTGVWRSWDTFRPDGSPDYQGEKDLRFQGWLVSSAEPASATREFSATPWGRDAIELVGEASLGGDTDPAARASAGRVPVLRGGKREGSYAWHVADESQKARVNAYRNPKQNTTLAQKRALVAGHRPDVTMISAYDNTALDFLPEDHSDEAYDEAVQTSGKLINLGQHDLLENGASIGKFRNHVSPYSLGLLTDVRNGGLKKDLTSIFEGGLTLPDAYNNRRLYESTHGITGVSDPFWGALAGYYNIYKELSTPDTNPTYYRSPTENVLLSTATPPRRFYPAPVIAKVETLFSFVVRDSHNNWVNSLAAVDSRMTRMGHLLYTPLVTLHNPYNVSVQFDRMQVVIRNLPVAFRFYVNGQPQNSQLLSINEMFVGNPGEKSFAMEIANWTSPTGSSTSGPITLKPGQTLVCSPYLHPSASFSNDNGTPFFDWENNLTGVSSGGVMQAYTKAKPGFTGKSVGYDIDWLTPPGTIAQTDGNQGVLGLRDTDMVHIEYQIKQPSRGVNDRFDITAQITSRGRSMSYGGLSFNYRNQSTLSRLYPEIYRFPLSGALPAAQMYHPNATPISAQPRARAIAMLSVYSRTANGGVYETESREKTAGALNALRDGRLAGKPFLHHNPARPVVNVNLATEKPGMHSHELNFQPLSGEVDDLFEIGSDNRTPSLLTHRQNALKAIKSGSYLELPSGPMQTIADFRRSNALSSAYLPNFVQPVGNSIVSPLMSTGSVVEAGVASYPLLDHSVLANHALYDGFYFSTFARNGSLEPAAAFEAFMAGEQPLPAQAFEPYLPDGVTGELAAQELFNGGAPASEAYLRAAEFQMVRGPFNVNSTSVEAWKAMLSAMNHSEVPVLWAKSGRLEFTTADGIPIPSMSLPNGGATNEGSEAADIDNHRTNEWNGYRSLSPGEIENLARSIVEQVRQRGPFLTMSEFVNRRIGSDSAQTRMGALQQAIEESGVNDTVYQSQTQIAANHLTDANLYAYRTPAVVEGNPAAGAPGWISQGDLLRVLEPMATVRSDTFVIRVCGEAYDPKGKVSARAFAEAVVQRLPEYVDPIDRPSLNVYEDPSSSSVNIQFGRRISILGFRWLSEEEI